MFRMFTSLVLVLSACAPEYDLSNGENAVATPNPPDLTAETKEDRIVQVTIPSVDVLWVIDNSCSMQEEQTALTGNFDNFVRYFVGSGLDYHIGVVSTDQDDINHNGKLQEYGGHRWIDDTVSNPEAIFKGMASLGVDGSANETGRAQVYKTLSAPDSAWNAGFYREDAYLAIVVISDEDDRSGNYPALNEFKPWLENLKPEEGQVSFSSIVGLDNSCSTASLGSEYLDVTRYIGGIEWHICDNRWDLVLEELGMQAAGLKREFFLSEVPVEATVSVRVLDDGTEQDFMRDVDWEYSRARNSIRFFSFIPNPLSEIFIDYEVLAGVQVTEEAE
jgi:hypothetical protein